MLLPNPSYNTRGTVLEKWKALSDITKALIISLGFCILIGAFFAILAINLEQIEPIKHERTVSVPVIEPVKVEVPVKKEISIEEKHAAFKRAFTIDQSCFDSKTGIWLLHSNHDEEDAEWTMGWYMDKFENVEYVEIGNGTIAIADTSAVFNTQVYPDVIGLDCKTHP